MIWREDPRCNAVSLVLPGILGCAFGASPGAISLRAIIFAPLAKRAGLHWERRLEDFREWGLETPALALYVVEEQLGPE